MAKPTPKKIQALSSVRISSLKPPTWLPTRQERLMGRDFNAYVMSGAPRVTSPPAGTPRGQMFLQSPAAYRGGAFGTSHLVYLTPS